MKKIIIIIIIMFICSLSINAQTVYVPCAADALIEINDYGPCLSWENTNYGLSQRLYAAEWTWNGPGCGQGTIRSVVYFDLNVPADPHRLYDNRAMLNLYFPTGNPETNWYTGSATDNQFYIQRIIASWGEMTVTWNNQPATTTTGQITVPSSVPNPNSQDYYVDISTLVYGWICNGLANYGMLLRQVGEGVYWRRAHFCSREFPDSLKHPTLALEYARIAASAPDSACAGNSFTVSCSLINAANPAQYQFQWTHLNSGTIYNTQNIINPASVPGMNSYVVIASNPWCQTANDTVNVYVTQVVSANASYNAPLCEGASLNLSASGGTSYQWSGPNGFSSALQNPVISNTSQANAGIYTVLVTDVLGCSDTASVNVVINPLPNITAGSNSPVCEGQTLNLTSGGGTAYYWAGPNGFTSPVQNPSVTGASPAASGTYTVTVTSGGCSSSTTTTATINANPILTVTPDPLVICAGDSDTLTVTGAGTYTWSPSTGLDTTSGPMVIVSPGISISYTVTGSLNGCTASYITDVMVLSPILADAGNHVHICAGTSTVLTASGGTAYSWTPATGLNSTNLPTVIASPLITTTYTVTASNGICTPASDTVTVYVIPLPAASITGDTLVCAEQATVLTASGGATYFWNTGATTSSITVYPSGPTTYRVTVTDWMGCPDTVSFSISTYNSINIYAGSDTTIAYGTSVQLNISGGTSWLWSPADGLNCINCQNPVATPEDTITYTVTGWDANGCSGTDDITIFVDLKCGEVYIPNAFSPNGDYNNDVLHVYGNCIASMDFMIYDRWGEKVYESSDRAEGWDGKFRGKDLDEGVYVYNLRATLNDGVKIKRTGNISLIR